MKTFDCLAVDCPLFGPHLLEASAGTGKTFAMEHVFVRLILADIPLEKILAVTFTRAATRELKERIRTNLEKALAICSGAQASQWGYLTPYLGSEEAILLLAQALKGFDRCQIFTIHGFCYRMLKEFAFEAGRFSLSDPDDLIEASQKMRGAMDLFWEKGIDSDLLCPEQIALLFGKYDTLQELGTALLRSQKPSREVSFSKWHRQFADCLKKALPISLSQLKEDFSAIRMNYKAHKGDFERQIEWLYEALKENENPLFFRKLIQHQGSLFSFLSPSNRKIKSKEPAFLHFPGFFDWVVTELGSVVLEASDRKQIFSALSLGWKEWEKKTVFLEGFFRPDEILEQMRKAIESPPFLFKMQEKFQAVIVDEFQDTDPLQWEIFHKIFLDHFQLKAFYLVGDPKQSIYRFRNADVYTYFAAREKIGEANLYHLDTNFRSSPEMIDSLNALFSRNWLLLPKKDFYIPYLPVRSGSSVLSDFADGKKALHWIVGSEESSYGETFLPYAVAEMERLNLSSKTSVGILVKDRYEMQMALDILRERNIAASAKNHESLADTFAFRSLREFLEAVAHPQDENACAIVELGPFSTNHSFSYWKGILEDKGMAKFFSLFFQESKLDADTSQIVEELLNWEDREGFSFEGLKRFFRAFEKLEVEEGSRRRPSEVDHAVQVLTLHMAKGLEFDIVFALALASSSMEGGEEEEELNAERLRQLYVAMTRAKKRLYIPFKESKAMKKLSPMDLFSRQIEADTGPFLPYLENLSKDYSLSFERISSPFVLGPCKKEIKPPDASIERPIFESREVYETSYINSFTSLAKTGEYESIQDPEEGPLSLPRGKETGTIIHALFEEIFSSSFWKKEESFLNALIQKRLLGSALQPWTSLVQEMVRKTLFQKISDGIRSFSLRQLEEKEVFAEMEFLYQEGSHFVKGFIDLTFLFEGKLYILDWKTNLLKDTTKQSVDEMMKVHDYPLQASLYAEGLRRHFGDRNFDDLFGGAFYLFVRTGMFTHFIPEKR